MKQTYTGKLTNWSNGEEDEILSLEGTDCPLAETIKADMDTHGRYLTVRYWTAEKEMTADELTEATVMMQCGMGKADYGMAYSEITGYLWTTEELEVGGHDLLEELKSHIGKWLRLEIEYARATPGTARMSGQHQPEKARKRNLKMQITSDGQEWGKTISTPLIKTVATPKPVAAGDGQLDPLDGRSGAKRVNQCPKCDVKGWIDQGPPWGDWCRCRVCGHWFEVPSATSPIDGSDRSEVARKA